MPEAQQRTHVRSAMSTCADCRGMQSKKRKAQRRPLDSETCSSGVKKRRDNEANKQHEEEHTQHLQRTYRVDVVCSLVLRSLVLRADGRWVTALDAACVGRSCHAFLPKPLAPVALLGGKEGNLWYTPCLLPAADCDRLFHEIQEQCSFVQPTVRMRGRTHVVQRLQSAHGDEGLSFVFLATRSVLHASSHTKCVSYACARVCPAGTASQGPV